MYDLRERSNDNSQLIGSTNGSEWCEELKICTAVLRAIMIISGKFEYSPYAQLALRRHSRRVLRIGHIMILLLPRRLSGQFAQALPGLVDSTDGPNMGGVPVNVPRRR